MVPVASAAAVVVVVVVASEVVAVVVGARGAKKLVMERIATGASGRLCPVRLFDAGRFLLPHGWQLAMCRARFEWFCADMSSEHVGQV